MKPPAVAGAEDHADEVLAVGELYDERVAAEMNKFVLELLKQCAYVGTSAFLVFALKYRVRVRVWYGSRCEELLAVYAPWALGAISNNALCHAVCCNVGGAGELGSIEDEARNTNHWVAAYPSGGDVPSLGEGEAEATLTFYALYLSLSLHVAKTVTDGDCGLDVMCLMLAWKRCKQNRDLLRNELATFALKHKANRAFVAILHALGELTTHLGLYELDSAGAALFADDVHHGDGAVPPESPVVPQSLVASECHFSDEDIRAMRWKCRLQKSPPEFIIDMLRRLPENCIRQTTETFLAREIAETKKSNTVANTFLLSRDARLDAKMKAVQSFLSSCQEKHGTLDPTQIDLLRRGRIPRGWFPEYVREHPQLTKACGVAGLVTSCANNTRYRKVYKLYSRAIQLVVSKDPAVAEKPTSAVAEKPTSVVAEDGVMAKFRNKTPRIGRQYFSTKWQFTREGRRRRALGGGRHRRCSVLREDLMLWYSIIRHSVDVKIMCRFPKKVLLVKAQMLQQDYYTA